MTTRSVRRALTGSVVVAALVAPSLASACSTDNTTWLESFVDQSCLVTPLVNTTLDAQGGLRLTTSGTPTPTTWDSDTNFTTGITHDTKPFGRVGLSTLAVSGAGSASTLELPTTAMALAPTMASVLGPTASAVPDGDHVDSPSVVKTPTGYVMYYVGVAEDGSDARIFRATSGDGKSWTRAATPNVPVLSGTTGGFDEMGVSGPT